MAKKQKSKKRKAALVSKEILEEETEGFVGGAAYDEESVSDLSGILITDVQEVGNRPNASE